MISLIIIISSLNLLIPYCYSYECFQPGYTSRGNYTRISWPTDGQPRFSNDTVLEYRCTNPTDLLIGSEKRTCRYGRWSGYMPYCASVIESRSGHNSNGKEEFLEVSTDSSKPINAVVISLQASSTRKLEIIDGAQGCLIIPSILNSTSPSNHTVTCTFRDRSKSLIQLSFNQKITPIKTSAYTLEDECVEFDTPRDGTIITSQELSKYGLSSNTSGRRFFKQCKGSRMEEIKCDPYADHHLIDNSQSEHSSLSENGFLSRDGLLLGNVPLSENNRLIDSKKFNCFPSFFCPLLKSSNLEITVTHTLNSLWNDTHAIAHSNAVYRCKSSIDQYVIRNNQVRTCVMYLAPNTLCDSADGNKSGEVMKLGGTFWSGCEPTCIPLGIDGQALDGSMGSVSIITVSALCLFAVFTLVGSIVFYSKQKRGVLRYQNSLRSQTYYYEPDLNTNKMKMSYKMGISIDDIDVIPNGMMMETGMESPIGSVTGQDQLIDGVNSAELGTHSHRQMLMNHQSLSVPNIDGIIESEEDGLGLRIPGEVSRGPSMIVNTSDLALNQSMSLEHGSLGTSREAKDDAKIGGITGGRFTDLYAVIQPKSKVTKVDLNVSTEPVLNGEKSGGMNVKKETEYQEVTMLIE